jgi:SPP1 family predicted phage head-tail adaptor
MRPIRAGKYRQRVQLQVEAPPEEFDSYGQPIPNWSTVGTYWAHVQPLSGHEMVAAKQVKAQATMQIEIRYQGDSIVIGPTNRLLLNGRQLGIFDVRNIEERDRKYTMVAYEIQQAGPV